MPDMIPVGNTIIPPDPMRGVNTLSGIIGIQQQRQNLQTGQYRQQEAAATAQQQGLVAQQAQGVQNFFKTWDPSQHVGKDGTTDLDSALQSDEFKASGNAKPAVMQALLDIKNKQLTNKTALASLNNDLVTQLGQQAGALAKDPDVIADKPDPNTGVNSGRAKIKEMFANFAQQSPDAARIAAIYSPIATHAPNTKGALSAGIGALQMQARDVGGQQGVQLPQPVQTGAGLVNRNPQTGDISAPRQVPNTAPANAPPPRAPANAAPPSPAAPRLGLNPTPVEVAAATEQAKGGAGIDVDRANQVGALQKSSKANIAITQEIDRLADDLESGHVAKMISETGNYFGMSSVNQARSQMVKDLGLVKGSVIDRAAAGSDMRAGTILEGYPTDTTPKDTTHAAMDYVRGGFRQNLARGDLLSKHGQTGFAGADNLLTRTTDPLMHEFMSLNTPAARVAFYRRNFQGNGQAAQQFKDEVDAFKKHTTLAGQ